MLRARRVVCNQLVASARLLQSRSNGKNNKPCTRDAVEPGLWSKQPPTWGKRCLLREQKSDYLSHRNSHKGNYLCLTSSQSPNCFLIPLRHVMCCFFAQCQTKHFHAMGPPSDICLFDLEMNLLIGVIDP